MELIINLPNKHISKALNTSKLVRKPVQVKGKNGKVFTRMQWIDPSSGQPVVEDRHPDDPHNAKRAKHSDNDKRRTLVSMYHDEHDTVRKFSHQTGMKNTEDMNLDSFLEHAMKNYDRIPSKLIDKHHRHYILSPKEEQRSREITANMVKEHAERAKEEDFDLSSLYKGTAITETEMFEYNHGKPDYTLDNDDYYNSEHGRFEDVLGGVTKEGLETLFTLKDKGIYAKLDDASMYNNVAEFCMHLTTPEGDYAGTAIRQIEKDTSGNYTIINHEFTLQPEHQGKGIAEDYYRRSEKLWKHNAGDKEVNVEVMANISVGVYAWAKKGYDFNGDYERTVALRELEDFCKLSLNSNLDEVLKNCNTSVDELQHSWDFANLKDENTYDFRELMDDLAKKDKTKSDIAGSGHLGKAFMLCGKTSWNGIKKL